MVGRSLVHHVERTQQLVNRFSEDLLVLDGIAQLVEIAAGALLDPWTPDVDDLLRRRWRLEARQALAHHHGDSFLERRIGAVGHVGVIAPMILVVQHGGEIAGHALHAARPDSLDARLFDSLEHCAGGRALRSKLSVHADIVTGQPQGQRIAVAAHDGDFLRGQLAGGFWQPRLGGLARSDQGGPVRRIGDFKLRGLRHGAHAGRDGALERLLRGLGFRGRLAVGGRAHLRV